MMMQKKYKGPHSLRNPMFKLQIKKRHIANWC